MKRKPYSILYRAVAAFLVVVLVLSDIPFSVSASEVEPAAEGGNSSNTAIVISDYNQNFIAYNYYCYLDSAGETQIGGTGYSISGSSSDKSVIIGDQTGDNLTEDQQPKTKDINVSLNGLTLSGNAVFEVRPVYGGANKVVAEVSGASSLAKLTLTEKAKMTLDVKTDTTITELNLADNTELSISVASGATLTLGTVTGGGKLTFSGAGTVAVSDKIEVSELDISGVTIDGNGTAAVTAVDSMALHSGTIQELALFGYADRTSGSRTLTLDAGNFYEVAALGVSESNTDVTLNITGLNSVGLNNTSVYQDYAITYQYNSASISGDNWPQIYRVKYASACDAAHATTVGSRTLPAYALAGYVFTGWQSGEGNPITELPSSGLTGDLTLVAQMQAGEVGVTFDLGFDPTELTNDKDEQGNLPSKTWTQSAAVGDGLTLSVPQRFGYVFAGWKITTGDTRLIPAENTSTTIAYSDLAESNGAYMLNLEAQWETDTFPIRLQPNIGFDGRIEDMQISVDGGMSWTSLDGLAEKYSSLTWDAVSKTYSFNIGIRYQETLGGFFKRVFGDDSAYPILQDTRTTGKLRFVCWKTTDGTTLRADSKFDFGEGGFLSKNPNVALSSYQNTLKTSPVILGTGWSSTLNYVLNTTLPEGWSILVGGKTDACAMSPDGDGTISVDAGQSVYYRVARSSDERISAWVFNADQAASNLYPVLETVASGDQYLYYKFIMPSSDVTASYCGGQNHAYVDIAKSPITLAENISYAGLSDIHGFWYNQAMTASTHDGLTVNAMTPLFFTTDITDTSAYMTVTGSENEGNGWYFYEYDWNKNLFYVTSCNVETTNQLTLVNQASIYLKDCKLTATDSFRDNAVGLNLNGQEFNKANVDLRGYGNIIIDRSGTNYIPNIIVDGSNTVACICTDKFYQDFQHYNSIQVSGLAGKDADTLTLGTILGSFAVELQNMTIQQYVKGENYTDFQAIVAGWKHGDNSYNSTMRNCVLDAPDRMWCGTYRTFFYDSKIDIKEFPFAQNQRVSQQTYGNCDVHVYGDINADHVFNVNGATTMVVDGNILMTSQSYTHTASINTTGYVIVKGNRVEFAPMNMQNGTLICNALMVSQASTFSGGTVITNILSEKAETGNSNSTETNADGYPFGRTVSSNSGTHDYAFTGSKVYLFGHYSTTENGNYDAKWDQSTTTMANDNPIKTIAEQYLSGKSYTDEELAAAVVKASTEARECVALGKTNYTVGSSAYVRNVRITGGAIYAAGNITFYNDTTVSGGTVVAQGSFASKRDLFITGGSVTAAEVGNAYNVSRSEDGIVRWAQTSITGGSVTTGRIGALSASIRNVEARSYVSIDEKNAKIASLVEGGSVVVCSDLKVNYHLADGLTQAEPMPANLRFQCASYSTQQSLNGQLRLDDTKIEFASPKASDGATAEWAWGSVNGEIAQYVNNVGQLNGESNSTYVYTSAKSMELYAVKSNNTLTIKAGDITQATVTDGNTTTDLTFTNGTANVKSGATVSFTVPAEMKDKVIVAYYDDSNVLYNACTSSPTVNSDGSYTFQFTMPRSATEIWVADSFDLYLNHYPVTFTKDGFATEYGTADKSIYTFDSSRSFSYQGDIRLSEEGATTVRNPNLLTTKDNIDPVQFSAGSATTNMIHFTGDFDNLSENGQKREIILSNLIQTYTEQGGRQTVLENDAQVRLGIDGHVGLYTIQVPQNASIEIYGKNEEKKTGRDLPDTLWLNGSQNYTLGNNNGICGKITLTGLFITQKNQFGGGIGCATWSNTTSSLTMRNCAMFSKNYYEGTWIARGVRNVTLDHCDLDICISTVWPGDLIQNCHDVTLTNGTKYTLKYGAQYVRYSPFLVTFSAKDTFKDAVFTIQDSSMDIQTSFGTNKAIGHSFDWMYDVVVAGNGSLTADRYLSLDKLTMKDTATVTVGDTKHNGYLFCSDITVKDKAELNAGYIAVSGFYTVVAPDEKPTYQQGAKTEDAWRKEVANGTNIRDGGTLTMNGGTVTATQFVGGDVNGKIVVNGGTLNAPRIGNLGAYLGVLTMMPTEDTEWGLFYEKVPTAGKAATVEISGGTVNVGTDGYLGGMNADVSISGGAVDLADGAVLGMTETQKTTLAASYSAAGDSIAKHGDTNCKLTVTGGTVSGSGSISAPYGTVEISEANGDTQVSVKDFTAESGTITIKNACDGLTNLYPKGESGVSDKVGVLVSGTLSARNLSILDGAAVYAGEAYSSAKAGESGVLEISQDTTESGTHTALYVGSYFGMTGDGEVDYRTVHTSPAGGYQQNVYGTKRVLIQYELCDDAIDPATNDAQNPDGFLVGSCEDTDYMISLSNPTRFGFDFDGWYEQADYSGERVTQILTTNNKDIVLYAKWTPRMIPFTVSVATDQVADLVTANETAELSGSFNTEKTIFTFDNTVWVPYRSVIIGTAITGNQLHLADYHLSTYSVTEMVWKYKDAQTVLSAGSTVVDRSMVDAYDSGSKQPLTLFVNAVAKRRFLLTMDLNLENGLPKDAVFNNSAAPDQSTSTTISSYTDFGKTFGDAAGFAANGGLITPTAPGYSFQEWNTKADGTGDVVTANVSVSSSSPHRIYAIWKANTYNLVFDAGDGNLVTTGSVAPTATDTSQTLTGAVVYDQQIDGNINFSGVSNSTLPYAWKKGYVFQGWSFENGTSSVTLTSGMKLNLTDIPSLYLNSDGAALTLHAVYRKIQVTYEPNGGTWTDAAISTGKSAVTVDAPDYGEALAGYVRDAKKDENGNYDLTGTVDSGNTTYAAYSTTIEGYNSNSVHDYVSNDYRKTIMRKGYTFFGWYTSAEAAQNAAEQITSGNEFFPASYDGAVGTVPEYEDIKLYASWKPNKYSLTLNAGESQYSEMVQSADVKDGQTVSLKIADEVKGTYITDNEIHWPKHSDWYTQTKGSTDDNAKRYLIGFTFDDLDPGDSQQDSKGYATYTAYAEKVTQLIQENAIFYKAENLTSGTIFQLPEDANYGSNVIPGTTTVPDYPTGYTIPLYAVYRERSLVFIEYVVDANGTPSRTVLASYPYNAYVDYPAEYVKSDSYQKLTAAGYNLIKWGVNGYGIDAVAYEQETYEDNKDTYKKTASDMGTFDINVYTVYAAQVTDTTQKLLAATGDPTASNVSTYTYKLPMSMQTGVIKYDLLANDGGKYDGFELVTKDVMEKNRYSSDYSNKIALTMQILDSNGTAVGDEVDLSSNGGSIPDVSVGAGYSVRLRMYHSSVMTTEESKTISLKCSFYRNSTGSEDMQQFFWLKNIQTKLTPSIYTVVYNAELPADSTVTEWNGFDTNGSRTVQTAYGSSLLDASPVVEGYSSENQWTRTDGNGTAYSDNQDSVNYGAKLTLSVSEADNGTIYLKSSYLINSYELQLSTEVLDKWTVRIDGKDVTETLLNSLTGEKTVSVNYYQTITFTGKTLGEPAEFIQLMNGDSSLGELDLYAASSEGNVYTFKMPDHNIAASYQNLKTLYLEDGSIGLISSATENGYQQGEQTLRTWRGRYQILMDAADNADGSSTKNRLVLDGDFYNRVISLGKLNITANDSIELKSGTKAVLKTSEIQAKNIAVPDGADLTLSSSGTTAGLTLTPDAGYAAIGGHDAASGAITLENLSISMTLPAGSAASGIGAGNQDLLAQCDSIRLTDCSVIVEEKTTASSAYTGSWIGGGTVTIQNSDLSKSPDSVSMSGPYVLRCMTASATGSKIGTSDSPVNDPIYASASLTFNDSEVHQRIEMPLGDTVALGTDADGTISVQKGIIDTSFLASGSSDSLYTGKLEIRDANSSVSIKNVQILDVNNGSVTIEQTQTVQNGITHSHSGSYLLLNEFNDYDGQRELTVKGLSSGAKVQTNALAIQKLTVDCDTPLELNGDLTVSGTAQIAEGKTLSVAAGTNTFIVNGFAGNGSYSQTGGTLSGTGDLIVGGNMTLDGVAAELTDRNLGSNGAAGVTTVTLQNSMVTAAQVGALGAQNETFTFVETDESTISGDLIQDHYRIKYGLSDAKYAADSLPKVLRSTTASGVTTYKPAIPAEPTYSGTSTSTFQNWYVTKPDGTNVALSKNPVSGFSEFGSLDASYLSDAVATEPNDGTKTLTLHAWMGMEGKATIQSGSIFEDIGSITDSSADSVSVVSNGQWTARFELQGTFIAGSNYQFAFEKPLPARTKLTLCDRSGGALKWYYYIAKDSVSSVTADEFIAMGDSSTAKLPDGNEGDALNQVLQLTADFSSATVGADDNKVSMKLRIGSETLDISGAELFYTTVSAASAAISATGNKITVTVTPGSDDRLNGKKLYAVAVIKDAEDQKISAPYGATARCGEIVGTWLGGNTIAFELGNYRALTSQNYDWYINGLPGGDYQVTWYLTAASDSQNPFECVLARKEPILFQQEASVAPSMTATLAQIDGSTPSGQILAAEQVHAVNFTVETNQTEVVYCVEKQSALKTFSAVSGSEGTVKGSKSQVTITIPGEAGTYRIRFSIKEGSEWDDVYYTFIVK